MGPLELNTNIQIVESFLSEEKTLSIYEALNVLGWHYGWRSNLASDEPFRHWHIEIADSGFSTKTSCLELLDTSPLSNEIREVLLKLRKYLPENSYPTRIYANAHTYGIDGRFHVDCKVADSEITALIYLNPIWEKSWGGVTLFAPKKNELSAVLPAPGRLVLFDGSILHSATAPSRECHDLRVTLILKFR
jgi:SM-20-related protein